MKYALVRVVAQASSFVITLESRVCRRREVRRVVFNRVLRAHVGGVLLSEQIEREAGVGGDRLQAGGARDGGRPTEIGSPSFAKGASGWLPPLIHSTISVPFSSPGNRLSDFHARPRIIHHIWDILQTSCRSEPVFQFMQSFAPSRVDALYSPNFPFALLV